MEKKINLENKIQAVIDKMNPYLKSHGGGVRLVRVKNKEVFLKIEGACVGCPFSMMTFGLGLEKELKAKVPQIKKINYV